MTRTNGRAAPMPSCPWCARPWATARPCWSTPTAAIRPQGPSKSAKLLEQHGVGHFEEPCPYWEFDRTKQVTDALALDVTGGEQDCDLALWKFAIEMRAVDVVQPDICYLGGIPAPCKWLGWPGGGPSLHAPRRQPVDGHRVHHAPHGSHLQRRALSRILDRGQRLLSWQEDFYRPALVARDGKVQIPEGPGLGG